MVLVKLSKKIFLVNVVDILCSISLYYIAWNTQLFRMSYTQHTEGFTCLLKKEHLLLTHNIIVYIYTASCIMVHKFESRERRELSQIGRVVDGLLYIAQATSGYIYRWDYVIYKYSIFL